MGPVVAAGQVVRPPTCVSSLYIRGALMAGKPLARKRCAQGPSRLVEKKIRVTSGTVDRMEQFIVARDKKPADAWRDVIHAGLASLGFNPVMSVAA